MSAKSKQLYYSKELSSSRIGDKPSNVIEKEVNHLEDKLFCKFFENKDGMQTKIIVIAPGTGGEYKLVIKKDGDDKTSTHSKSEILAFLKKNKNLDFMVKYITSAKSLSRARSKTRPKSKSRSKSKSRTVKKSKSRTVKKSTSKTAKKSKSRTVKKSSSKRKKR